MSRVCELCGKKAGAGHNVSHSKRRTNRRFNPNLVTKRFGRVQKLVCTACLRTIAKAPHRKTVVQSTESVSAA